MARIVLADMIDGRVEAAATAVNLKTVAGAVGDGVTNDATAIQTAVTAAPYGTTFYAPAGTYLLRSGIKWKSGVSLIGAGPGHTILKPYNAGPLASGFSCIYDFTDGTVGAPLQDVMFADFEIDGTGITTTSYDVGSKGINILYITRAFFRNLYVHACAASGIGSDQLVDSMIADCVCNDNGRQVGLGGVFDLGGSGIGIGTGKYAEMSLSIVGCTVNGNGNHGIFLEHQPGTSVRSFGIRVVNCHASANRYGISDWGVDGLTTIGCTFNANTVYGWGNTKQGVAGFAGTNGLLEGCTFTGHTADSIRLGDGITRYAIRGNLIKINGTAGTTGTGAAIRVADVDFPGSTNSEMTITDNDIVSVDGAGIRIDSTFNYGEISNNRIRNCGRYVGNAPALRAGISINAATTSLTVRNNTCWDGQGTKTQTYGLSVIGAATNPNITGNNFARNLTGDTFGVVPVDSELSGTSTTISTNNNALRQDGAGTSTTSGTLTYGAGSATLPQRLIATSAATANALAGVFAASVPWLRGGATTDLFGGFKAHATGVRYADASYDSTGVTTGSRLWPLAMYAGTSAALYGADRGSGTVDAVGFVRAHVNGGAADTNWQFVTCDATTTTTADTGVLFTPTSVYDFAIWCACGSATVVWEIVNQTTGTAARGTATLTLPRTTAALGIVSSGLTTIDAVTRAHAFSRLFVVADHG